MFEETSPMYNIPRLIYCKTFSVLTSVQIFLVTSYLSPATPHPTHPSRVLKISSH